MQPIGASRKIKFLAPEEARTASREEFGANAAGALLFQVKFQLRPPASFGVADFHVL